MDRNYNWHKINIIDFLKGTQHSCCCYRIVCVENVIKIMMKHIESIKDVQGLFQKYVTPCITRTFYITIYNRKRATIQAY